MAIRGGTCQLHAAVNGYISSDRDPKRHSAHGRSAEGSLTVSAAMERSYANSLDTPMKVGLRVHTHDAQRGCAGGGLDDCWKADCSGCLGEVCGLPDDCVQRGWQARIFHDLPGFLQARATSLSAPCCLAPSCCACMQLIAGPMSNNHCMASIYAAEGWASCMEHELQPTAPHLDKSSC